jgi:hypothetical protein
VGAGGPRGRPPRAPAAAHDRLPATADLPLERYVRNFEVADERLSTTRYIARLTVTYDPAAVRNLLQERGVAFAQTPSEPLLVLPLYETPDGGLRSYGSMTYAGLKSMIYAGLTPEDPRVQAAYEWIQRHYTVEENPGMGPQGLFYYYHTFAKALGTLGHEELTDAEGQPHDWRADLARQLLAAQQDDGSWVNEHPRWLEGDPNLVTGYALMALAYCREE